MAAAGQFVRERIPIPASVPEAGRLVLELVSSSRDSAAEAAGPMTFRIVRRYRPTWASITGFLIAPLFIRNTEVCRVAVIEARVGAELLLEGAIDPELHGRLLQLGRVPEAARVSTLGPRPVPPAFSPHPGYDNPPPPPAPPFAAPAPAYQQPAAPAYQPPPAYQSAPEVVDLRDSARPIDAPVGRSRRDDFADLIPPPLLPPGGGAPSAPAGPSPSFAPHQPPAPSVGNGSNGGSHGRLPSAFRSPRDAVQAEGMSNPALPAPPPPAPPAPPAQPAQQQWRPMPAAPGMPPNDLFTPQGGDRSHALSRTPPGAAPEPARQQPVRVSVDSGEDAEVTRLLIVGRAPTRQPHEGDAALLTVNDPSLSVSKTHLAIEVDGAGLWVVDRNSTNGTWIDEGRGALRPVPANQRTPVPPGARVLIGERVVTFTRPTS